MTFEQVAERLRKHGITCGVMAYGSGYAGQLAVDNFGFEYTPLCNTLEEAAKYLHATAKRLYPDTYGKDEA